ncbi:MAG: glycosyltransferase family 1 protein, partial [Acidobacteria bacterium]|nr:glycosyltransferase family 1 protein [Acidobacteriota bacterium]
ALHHTLSDRGLRERMAVAGLARVGQFSWERVAADTYKLYQQVLRERTDPVSESRIELAA